MKIIYTDLDGTLLDKNSYSYKGAKKGLQIVKSKAIPWIICTSKTRCEIEYWRKKLCNKYPFISENGGGVFIPKKFFNFDVSSTYQTKIYDVIEVGTRISELTEIFLNLKKKYCLKSFLEMSPQEIKNDAHIPLAQAILAKNREYDIPFKILDMKEKKKIIADIHRKGLIVISGGRYFHLMGNTNKGKAVKILSELLKRKYKTIVTVGIGDSENDFSMLDNVDRAYLLKENNDIFASDKYLKVRGIGPVGWTEIIEKEIKDCR